MTTVLVVLLVITVLNGAALTTAAITCPIGRVSEFQQESILPNDDGSTDRTIGIYLNLDQPATCEGVARMWHYCFHIPGNNIYPNLQAEFGVYRQQGGSYVRIPNSKVVIVQSAVTLSPSDCFSFDVSQPFTVSAGDVVGACIPRSLSSTHGGLDIPAFSAGQQLYQPSDAGICDFVASTVDTGDFILRNGLALQLHLVIESTNPPTPCGDACQDISTNTSVNVKPTASYTTTLLHDIGPTNTNTDTIIPTTTTSMPLQEFPFHISASSEVSSPLAPSSSTPLRDTKPTAISTSAAHISTTATLQGVTRTDPTTSSMVVFPQLVSEKLTSSIERQSITQTAVEQSHLIPNMQSILTPSLENNPPESISGLNVGAITGIAVATAFLLGLSMIIIIFIAYRKWWRHNAQERASKVSVHAAHVQTKMCTNQFYESQKLVQNHEPNYCEPATTEEGLYVQIQQQKIKVIYREALEIYLPLGKGQFGVVDRAIWTDSNGMVYEVAVKSLSNNVSTNERTKLLQEAAIMGQFSHPNVLKLYGIVLETDLIMLVSEIAHNGDLKKYLKAKHSKSEDISNQDTRTQFLKFSIDIAKGMHYLSSKGFVHRDLAARNVLLTTGMTCKIADFGMSRDLMDDAYYVSQNNLIPLKWTAPEAVYYRKYSSASDVWSFGCLLYEIWTIGHDPYENLNNSEVLVQLANGYSLEPPTGCPAVVSELMHHCWYTDTHLRPSFRDIVTTLVFKEGKSPQKIEAASNSENETEYYNVAHTYLKLSAFRH